MNKYKTNWRRDKKHNKKSLNSRFAKYKCQQKDDQFTFVLLISYLFPSMFI